MTQKNKKRRDGFAAAERKEIRLGQIEQGVLGPFGPQRLRRPQGQFKRWSPRGTRVAQAVQILKESPPITEKKIKELSRVDFKLREIDFPPTGVNKLKKYLLGKYLKGELK